MGFLERMITEIINVWGVNIGHRLPETGNRRNGESETVRIVIVIKKTDV
jgi:hypothetical protein